MRPCTNRQLRRQLTVALAVNLLALCGCDPASCDVHASPEDLRATPRPDARAETLALMLSPGPVAEEETYQRIIVDLEAIERLDPVYATYEPARGCRFGPIISFSVTDRVYERILDGTFTDWDELNRIYHVEEIAPIAVGAYRSVQLSLNGLYNLEVVGTDYACLEGLSMPAFAALFDPRPPTWICVTQDEGALHYGVGSTSCDGWQTFSHIISAGPGDIRLADEWTEDGSEPPDWVVDYAASNCAFDYDGVGC